MTTEDCITKIRAFKPGSLIWIQVSNDDDLIPVIDELKKLDTTGYGIFVSGPQISANHIPDCDLAEIGLQKIPGPRQVPVGSQDTVSGISDGPVRESTGVLCEPNKLQGNI